MPSFQEFYSSFAFGLVFDAHNLAETEVDSVLCGDIKEFL